MRDDKTAGQRDPYESMADDWRIGLHRKDRPRAPDGDTRSVLLMGYRQTGYCRMSERSTYCMMPPLR